MIVTQAQNLKLSTNIDMVVSSLYIIAFYYLQQQITTQNLPRI